MMKADNRPQDAEEDLKGSREDQVIAGDHPAPPEGHHPRHVDAAPRSEQTSAPLR